MRKLFLTISMLLVLTPVLSADGDGPMLISQGNDSPQPTLYQVQNQTQLRQQISVAVQIMNQTRIRINQTEVLVNSSGLIVNATQLQKQIRITNQEIIVNGLQLINESTSLRVQVMANISAGPINKSINIIMEQNRVRLMEEGSDVMVELALNNQLRLQDNQLILNASGTERNITVLPTQAMNLVRATNQTIRSIELVIEQERALYNIQEQRTVRLFGLIPIGMTVQSRVDATNNELVSVQKPWWSFLTLE
jgi:hypothetical protein